MPLVGLLALRARFGAGPQSRVSGWPPLNWADSLPSYLAAANLSSIKRIVLLYLILLAPLSAKGSLPMVRSERYLFLVCAIAFSPTTALCIPPMVSLVVLLRRVHSIGAPVLFFWSVSALQWQQAQTGNIIKKTVFAVWQNLDLRAPSAHAIPVTLSP